MIIYEWEFDESASGQHHTPTQRYIPVAGGSRSNLPVADDINYPRYYGFIGMDEELTESIHLIDDWYNFIGGEATIPEGPGGALVQLLMAETEHSTAPRD